MTLRWAAPFRSLLWLPGLALTTWMVLLLVEGIESDRQLTASLAAVGVLLTWASAIAVRQRYPERPLATLLFVLATFHGVSTALGASSQPGLFTAGRVLRPVFELLLLWVMLAFPSGRLAAAADRWLLGAAVGAILLLWLPANLLSQQFPLPGSWVRCAADCPANLLFVREEPALARALIWAFRGVGLLILLGVALRLWLRWRRASPLMRRAIAPVQWVSMLRLVATGAFVATGIHHWGMVLIYWAVPVAIVYGLLRGRLWISGALQQLVSGLRAAPDRYQLQRLMATALGDPSLQLAYWLPEPGRWVDADGGDLQPPDASTPGRASRVVCDAAGAPVALLVHDAMLLEEPALIEAVANSMQMVLAGQQLEAMLRDSRLDAAGAMAAARRGIEQDLHDGAQQRLVALRLKVGVAERVIESDAQRAAALLAELGPDIDAALAELRELTHGQLPAGLAEHGLSAALTELARRAGRPVHLDLGAVGRLAAATEKAVYFCCAEALQNACKHAGSEAELWISLRADATGLRFAVRDSGSGRPGAAAGAKGPGLAHLRQRLAAVGGRLAVQNDDTQAGLVVAGWVPF